MDPQTAAMMASAQDYDNLKRADCMAFGQEVLRSVTAVKKGALNTLRVQTQPELP